jgi:hypothetical protein
LLIDLQDFKKEAEFHAKLQGAVRPKLERTGWGSTTPARAAQPALDQTSSPRRWLGVVAALLSSIVVLGYFAARKLNVHPAPAGPRSLAVLPFRNLRQEPETDFLGFSLADAVITKLGYVGALTVRPSSSIDKYRNQIIDPRKWQQS